MVRPRRSVCTTRTPGRSQKAGSGPVEFGHKAQVADNEDGIVLDHDTPPGNPVRPTIRSSPAEVCRPTTSTSGRVMLPSTALTTGLGHHP